MKNKCQVAEVALVDLCLTFGMGDGSTDRKGEAASFLLSQASGPLMLLLLISHVGSNLCVRHDNALMSELKVSSREFSLAPSVTLSFEYAQRVAGIRRQGCSASPPHIACH